MDLCEITKNTKRHPWESARVKALRKILKKRADLKKDLSVLDVGCGDAFIARNLFEGINIKSIDGVDIELSEDQIRDLSSREKGITFYNCFDSLQVGAYDLILLLDVIEHVEDDTAFLSKIINRYINEEGYMLITVPAFQSLFSSHDTFLSHYRRYGMKELIQILNRAGIKCVCSGYLFFSLLAIRFLLLCYARFVPGRGLQNKGVGAWKYSIIITKMIEFFFTAENNFSIALSSCGIKLPGLTVWALCKKQQL